MSSLRAASSWSATLTSGEIRELPTMQDAIAMPRHVSELSGEQLFMLAEMSGGTSVGVARERMRREIMMVDKIDYAQTHKILTEMAACASSNHGLIKAPSYVAIYTALVAGWASLPLVFHYPSAELFNMYFVTADPPDVGEADTWLEVGSWSWSWMEPPLGAVSFFLLCIQFAREQRMSIGGKAMTDRIMDYQAERLSEAYPMYAEDVVRAYGAAIALIDDSETIAEEQVRIERCMVALKGKASK